MSSTEVKDDKELNGQGTGPTRSFDSLAPGPGSQVGFCLYCGSKIIGGLM